MLVSILLKGEHLEVHHLSKNIWLKAWIINYFMMQTENSK